MTPSHGGAAGEVRPAPGDLAGTTARDGLFGPGSVTWRVHSDPTYPLAVLRALMMQVLHVPAMSVVFATARRLDDPWERLHHSVQVLGTMTFGDAAEAAIMGARERSVRMQVTGSLPDGRHFRGDDVDVLRWLHACQVDSALEVTARCGLELSDASCNQYLREQARAAAVTGLEPEEVPRSRAELLRALKADRSQLRVTREAREFMQEIVSPALPAAMLAAQRNRPSWAPIAGLVFPTLPHWARSLYGPPPEGSPAALSPSAATIALHTLRDSLRTL
ncbi:oxygenase MpaB family protein [Spongisporangium articulatum]|uniref:Oxygenase MpaB family protein n=1 Tax=Spongisporangium articulatum TaxID=3362603 RepID=A0ABW8APZ6_9ACTN